MKKCHDCKSTNVAKILYGYPADMDKWKKDMDSGKFVAGGCVVRDDDPKWSMHQFLGKLFCSIAPYAPPSVPISPIICRIKSFAIT